jgi:hypothetical protein
MIINPHIFKVLDIIAPTIPGPMSFANTSGTGYRILWGSSTDDSGGIIEYELYRDGVLETTTTNLHYDLFFGSATYFDSNWKVRAKDTSGNISAFNNETGWASLTVAPVLTAGLVSDSEITNTWDAPTGANSYEYEYKLSSSGTWLNAPDDTSPSTVSLLNSSSFYDFRVRAFNPYNQPSSWSTTLSVGTSETVDTTPPTEPTNITALAYPEQPWADVEYTGGTDAGSGVKYYECWRWNGSAYVYIGRTDEINYRYLDTNVLYNTIYYYKGKTVDHAGNKSALSLASETWHPNNK